MNGNLLEINDLHVNVGEKEILKGLNLSIPFNEIHAIMGPNGSGKSVLSNVLSGNEDYKVTSGQIIFKNENIIELKPNEIYQDQVTGLDGFYLQIVLNFG